MQVLLIRNPRAGKHSMQLLIFGNSHNLQDGLQRLIQAWFLKTLVIRLQDKQLEEAEPKQERQLLSQFYTVFMRNRSTNLQNIRYISLRWNKNLLYTSHSYAIIYIQILYYLRFNCILSSFQEIISIVHLKKNINFSIYYSDFHCHN